jgi:hypothetical protein
VSPIRNEEEAKVKCPTACQASNATWTGKWTPPKDGNPWLCNCQLVSNKVVLRQKFEDYTGAYVIHCHFLGHEDRGMMWNVQTVCDRPGGPRFGKPQPTGTEDNCQVTSPALPKCSYAVP